MRIFVTGGAGYVGSACLRFLRARGHQALAYDNLAEGHRAAVSSAELIQGDIAETERVITALRDFRADAVMHFAAYAYVGESVTEPSKYYQNNLAAPIVLLDAIGTALDRAFSIEQDYGCLNIIDYLSDGHSVVRLLNGTAHQE